MNRWTALAAVVAALFGATVALVVAAKQTTTMQTCITEDGFDGTGIPCVWTDPNTGRKYVVDGR